MYTIFVSRIKNRERGMNKFIFIGIVCILGTLILSGCGISLGIVPIIEPPPPVIYYYDSYPIWYFRRHHHHKHH